MEQVAVSNHSTHIAVIGAGPAGLMAAEVMAQGGERVTIFDRMPAAGRKFLLAGRGGLNLTHSEPLGTFLGRYGAATPHLRDAIDAFPPEKLRAWCEGLDQEIFVGSSGRVFPKSLKASPLLRGWLRRLESLGVVFRPRHRWSGWRDDGALMFETPAGGVTERADAAVLALGGASWPRLGSDGSWVEIMGRAGIGVAPLRPANVGVLVSWSNVFRDRFEGTPLKRIALSLGVDSVRGEARVTRAGLEGGVIYALSAAVREAIDTTGKAVLHIDFRPDLTVAALAVKLRSPRGKQSLSTFLRKAASLSPVAIGLLHEAQSADEKLSARSPEALADLIKAVPVHVIGIANIARAISTAGGIAFDEIDPRFMLRRMPGTFVAGEMLDWEAPTGGYLLQACFATGMAAGRGALAWLNRSES
ncbi:MAG: TIGR03862 family flavoprotein [Rhizobiales bacterium]|nr:TIGR03862 family flavoprotein [Hyphomicrobiales bacterium]